MTRTSSKGATVYSCPVNHSGGRCPAPAVIGCHRLDPYVELIALTQGRKTRKRIAELEEELQSELARVRHHPERRPGLGGVAGARRHERNALHAASWPRSWCDPPVVAASCPLPIVRLSIRHGAPVELAGRRGESSAGIVPIPFNPHGPDVLRMAVGKDRVKGAGGALKVGVAHHSPSS